MTYARRALPFDLPEILEMARAFHAESPLHSPYLFSTEKVENLVGHAINAPEWCPVVAIDDAGLCGMALVFAMPMFFSDALQGGDLAFYVPQTRRGSLAAREMAEFIEQWRTRMGVVAMDIGINTGINHDRALSFFMKCGYRPVGIVVRK